jgi:predicted AAA+ superfamily ATPase
MPYVDRVLDSLLSGLLESLPAIAIEGPRAVGKTETATRRAATILELDDPAELNLLAADPERLTRLSEPILVDEWQRLPAVWDWVRRAVDRDPRPARFLLTGSATPTSAPTHSGAGRIIRLRMRPMTLAERGLAPPTVSLRALLEGERAEVRGDSTLRLGDYVDELVASGFPALRRLPAHAREAALDGYLQGVLEHDFPELGYTVRRPATLRAWLTAYAAATSTTTSYNAILDASTSLIADKPAKTTALAYRDVLSKLWLLDEVPAWTGTSSSLAMLAQAPKHHLADPALAARLLGVGSSALLDFPHHGPPIAREGSLLGSLFESLVTLCVRVYAEASRATLHHLRTRRGEHEVDLIVRRDDGRFVAIEVKLGSDVTDGDVRHLRWLRAKAGDALLDSVVVTTGPGAYRRSDGIAVVPAALLGP